VQRIIFTNRFKTIVTFVFLGLLLILRIAHVARGLQLMVSCDKGFDIRVTSLCDGKADCVDGTDEKYVGTGFKCRMNGSKRYPLGQVQRLYFGC